jgi:prophage regulatory protein
MKSEIHKRSQQPVRKNMETALKAVLFRLGQVEQATGLKKSAIYAKIKTGEFPAAVRLGSRSVAWRSDDIQAWIDGLPKMTEQANSAKQNKGTLWTNLKKFMDIFSNILSIIKLCQNIFPSS